MKKALKLLICFLCLILVLSGCNYQIDHSKTEMYDIEKIKDIKELENSTEIKDEFLKQFEKIAGFPLPEYFVFPESKGSIYTSVDERNILVLVPIVMNKKDALEILSKVKSDDEWTGYRYWSDVIGTLNVKIEKNKQKCTYFIKKSSYHTFIELNFHYNENNDNYIVTLFAFVNRDLPQESNSSGDIG